ncbi:MAG: DeoR family transcriptional regulator [Lachnospiraceae bacterium]|nr:DeoR family transcriptional regulator [Lachnospiraceae bacterium]
MWYVFIGRKKKPIKFDRNERIVQYLKEHGSISNMEARELLGLADSTVKRLLKEMVDSGVLTVEGEHKARRYLLKDEE